MANFPIIRNPRSSSFRENERWYSSFFKRFGIQRLVIHGKASVLSKDYQLRLESDAGFSQTMEFTETDGTNRRGQISAGSTVIAFYGGSDPVATAHSIMIHNGSEKNFGIGAVPQQGWTVGLDVRKEVLALGDAVGGKGRLRVRGPYAANPANPDTNEADWFIFDDGATVQFRVRYNDAGVMKTGSFTLV